MNYYETFRNLITEIKAIPGNIYVFELLAKNGGVNFNEYNERLQPILKGEYNKLNKIFNQGVKGSYTT